MMKWKVIRNPRCASAEPADCLHSEVPSQNSDSNNNNSTELIKKDVSPLLPAKKQQQCVRLSRKDSLVAKDCINLKGILGLSRQRSETNLSTLDLLSREPRRSRSEARGSSRDRLTVGYHTTPSKAAENGKTRCSSPPCKSNWLRGRKREREPRNNPKNDLGKTVVTGSVRKEANRTTSCDSRTIIDGCDGKVKVCTLKSSNGGRRAKSISKPVDAAGDGAGSNDVVYSEIDHDNIRAKLLEENREVSRDPNRVIRKKGMAPKPQISNELFKDRKDDVNLNSNDLKTNLVESKSSPCPKPPRRSQGRNVGSAGVAQNNLKNSAVGVARSRRSSSESTSLTTIAEVYKTPKNSTSENQSDENRAPKRLSPRSFVEHKQPKDEVKCINGTDSEPFHIDTPDYSTLNSELENDEQLLGDIDRVDAQPTRSETDGADTTNCSSEIAQGTFEVILNSMNECRNASSNRESESLTSLGVEKIDLIEAYKQQKTNENSFQNDNEDNPSIKDSDDIDDAGEVFTKTPDCVTATPETGKADPGKENSPSRSESRGQSIDKGQSPKAMTLNVVVRNPSPIGDTITSLVETQIDDSQTQFVMKKSFVLTIAKQEKGFQSLCANRKPEMVPDSPRNDHQISVTFLCSEPPSETWIDEARLDSIRLRSLSVPPKSRQLTEVAPTPVQARSRSKERRTKERQYLKKNHKTRKKDAVFNMPQAVIDELSQVLEKRKPSLDGIVA